MDKIMERMRIASVAVAGEAGVLILYQQKGETEEIMKLAMAILRITTAVVMKGEALHRVMVKMCLMIGGDATVEWGRTIRLQCFQLCSREELDNTVRFSSLASPVWCPSDHITSGNLSGSMRSATHSYPATLPLTTKVEASYSASSQAITAHPLL